MKKRSILNIVYIVLIIIGIIYISFIYFIQINSKAPSKIEDVQIYEISSNNLNEISSYLKENELIKNKNVFKIKAFLSGISGKLGKGKYELSPSMDNDEIIAVLSTKGIKEVETVKVTIQEGYTIEDIANTLFDNNVIYDKDVFLSICKDGDRFKNHKALSDITFSDNEDIKYYLEGYLFPDTYEFYKNSSSEKVIEKMLNRFGEVYTDEYIAKMKEYGLSKSDVIILASIIEKEGKTNDFSKISSVLHTRIKKNIPLQVDASLRYLNNLSNTISVTSEQYNKISSYNTYKNNGLPPTAICNPSKNAIEAVLYPDEEYLKEGYMYFCLTDLDTGTMVFSKTYEEHINNVKKYRENWEEYDNAIE